VHGGRPGRGTADPAQLSEIDPQDETDQQSDHGDHEEPDHAEHPAEQQGGARDPDLLEPATRYGVLHHRAQHEKGGRYGEHGPGGAGAQIHGPDHDRAEHEQRTREDRHDHSHDADRDGERHQHLDSAHGRTLSPTQDEKRPRPRSLTGASDRVWV
jgi:hypothetical protein